MIIAPHRIPIFMHALKYLVSLSVNQQDLSKAKP